MSMSDKDLEQIVTNEIEWRKSLYKKLEKNEEELNNFKTDMNAFKIQMIQITTTLKVKIGIAGALFGLIGGSIGSLVLMLLNNK